MERRYDFDLTYVTEKIISVFFPAVLEEERYRANLKEVSAMLKSKHQDKFQLFNLSEKRHDIIRLNPKVSDFGWPDLHAPHLDKISAICRAMETWLTSDPQHVVVLHCKGHRGKTEVIVSAYMHYSEVCAGADRILSTLAMKRFCEDKVLSSLHPSQNRYISYFRGLLSGAIKMSRSPLFLHQVLIPNLPNFQAGRGYFPFLRIYQSMQLVYTSGVYNPQGSSTRRLCIAIEPALLLKGEVMVKCYHWRAHGRERDAVFRLQFHTGTVQGARLWFSKEELDEACNDEKFPADAKVEFVFSSGSEKIKGCDYSGKSHEVMVECASTDPLLRWDSYENFNLRHQDSTEDITHTPGPLDGSLYAQVKKRHGPGSNTLISTNDSPAGRAEKRHGSPVHINSTTRYLSAPTEHSRYPPRFSRWQKREELHRHLVEFSGMRAEGDGEMGFMDTRHPAPVEHPGKGRAGPWSLCCGEPTCMASMPQSNGYCPDRSYNFNTRPTPPISPHSRPATSPEPMVMCQHRNTHSHHSLPWNLQCYSSESSPQYSCSCQTQGVSLPSHAYTLPPSSRLPCRDEEFAQVHQSSNLHQLCLHRSQTPNVCREMLLNGRVSPGRCCQREDLSVPVSTFHALRIGQGDPEDFRWAKEVATVQSSDLDAELRRETDVSWNREGAQNQEDELTLHSGTVVHWEKEEGGSQWEKDSEFCHRNNRRSPYMAHVSSFDSQSCPPPVCTEPSLSQSHSSSHSNLDLKTSSSSGYQTPQRPCSCSTDQPSLSESRGYASGYQSGSTSPLPTRGEDSVTSLCSSSTHDCFAPVAPVTGHCLQGPSHSKSVHLSESVVDTVACHHQVSQISQKAESLDANITCSAPSEVSRSPGSSNIQSPCPGETEFFVTEVRAVPARAACFQPQESEHKNVSLSHSDSQCITITCTASPINTRSPEPTSHPEESTFRQPSGFSSSPSPEPTCSGLESVKVQPSSSLSGHGDLDTWSSTRGSSSCSSTPQPSPSFSQPPQGSQRCHPPPCSPSMAQKLGAESSGHHPPHANVDDHSSHRIPQSCNGSSTPSFPMSTKYYPLSIPLLPYTGYTAVTIPSPQPALPEKQRIYGTDATHRPGSGPSGNKQSLCPKPQHVMPPSFRELPSLTKSDDGSLPLAEEVQNRVKFVQDRSQFWYKPDISRDQAVAALKGKEPGAFLIRDSSSFQGAYGLALKVAVLPLNAAIHSSKGDPQEQLVRHFLIEKGPRGVKIRGCPIEPHFGSLSALVHQHSITPVSLPCTLRLPESDPVRELQAASSTSTAADLLKQGAACNVLYLNSVETESLTGPKAVAKAAGVALSGDLHPGATVVHFKVSAQGITLTDNERRLFFRRHYPVSTVIFSSVDPQERRWTNSDSTPTKIFGFVAKKPGSVSDNICHLFAELDPEQPATAIVNFINKVLLRLQGT
ncbi:tensin-2-like [Scleropages formosus]|nr:tensin-2-like [Scleropages formosus]